jgi:hypothetical protein
LQIAGLKPEDRGFAERNEFSDGFKPILRLIGLGYVLVDLGLFPIRSFVRFPSSLSTATRACSRERRLMALAALPCSAMRSKCAIAHEWKRSGIVIVHAGSIKR